MNINLSKEQLKEEVKINLTKTGFDINNTCAKVCFVVDESSSMSNFYYKGVVRAILDKLLAISFYFDDDGDIDMFAFNTVGRQLPSADQDSYGSYDFKPNFGGTGYSDVMEKVVDYYYKSSNTSGFFKMFTSGGSAPEGRAGKEDKLPVYVFFLTDGETLNPYKDTQKLSKLLNKNEDMFVQFIGVGNNRFQTIHDIVEEAPENSDFAHILNLEEEGDDLISKIITQKAYNIIQKN